jgi:hypothetical protein
MRLVRVLVALWAAIPGCADGLADDYVYGFGNVACGEYLGFRAGDRSLYEAAKTWTTGYLTAMAEQFGKQDLLAGMDMNGAAAWLDGYCAQNPADRFYVASHQLAIFLARRSHAAAVSGESSSSNEPSHPQGGTTHY